jgi:hypothetical protein
VQQGGRFNDRIAQTRNVQSLQLQVQATDSVIVGGSGQGRVQQQGMVERSGTLRQIPRQQEVIRQTLEQTNLTDNQRQMIQNYSNALNRPVANPAPVAAVHTPAAAGNRLNVQRVEGAAGLCSESRDAGRGNALIHKSFIKK